MSLTLADANRLANAAITEASKSGTAISVSICDASGRLVAHQRMDGVFDEAPLFSIGKAVATIRTGQDSGEPAYSGYSQSPAGEVIAEGAPVIQRKGGLPIFQSGRLVGAIGVSGASTDDQDERCARAALALNG